MRGIFCGPAHQSCRPGGVIGDRRVLIGQGEQLPGLLHQRLSLGCQGGGPFL
jgi:hypothetical protein